MSESAWLPWLTGNHREDWVRGPVYSGYGFALAGMKAREQHDFGIIDIAVQARSLDEKRNESFSWMTRNTQHDRETLLETAPRRHVLVGLEVREQGGYGIVDARLIFRSLRDDSESYGRWLCDNPNGRSRSDRSPEGTAVTGIELREQSGFGVIDVRLSYTTVERIECSCESGSGFDRGRDRGAFRREAQVIEAETPPYREGRADADPESEGGRRGEIEPPKLADGRDSHVDTGREVP